MILYQTHEEAEVENIFTAITQLSSAQAEASEKKTQHNLKDLNYLLMRLL